MGKIIDILREDEEKCDDYAERLMLDDVCDSQKTKQDRRKKQLDLVKRGKRFRDECHAMEDAGFKTDLTPPELTLGDGKIPPEFQGGACGNRECQKSVPDYQGVHGAGGTVYCSRKCHFSELKRRAGQKE